MLLIVLCLTTIDYICFVVKDSTNQLRDAVVVFSVKCLFFHFLPLILLVESPGTSLSDTCHPHDMVPKVGQFIQDDARRIICPPFWAVLVDESYVGGFDGLI